MKFLVFALMSILVSNAQAGSIKEIDSCKISPMDKSMVAKGRATLTEVGLDLLINVKATLGELEEKPNTIEGEESISIEKTVSGQELAEFIAGDEAAELVTQRLGQEKAKTLSYYQTKGFEDDGNGFVYYRVTGEKGTRLGLLLIGWGAVYCD